MKKLLEKDKKLRVKIANSEIQLLVLKSIAKNLNFFSLTRWNASLKLNILSKNSNIQSLIYKCPETINKKRFNKNTKFSRYYYLKQIREAKFNGITKSSW